MLAMSYCEKSANRCRPFCSARFIDLFIIETHSFIRAIQFSFLCLVGDHGLDLGTGYCKNQQAAVAPFLGYLQSRTRKERETSLAETILLCPMFSAPVYCVAA